MQSFGRGALPLSCGKPKAITGALQVLSRNAPAGGGWYWSIIGNSMVVAGIKIGDSQVSKPAQITLGCSGFSELIVPRAAVKLAMFRHAVSKDNILEADPKVVITINRRQVETMILFEVTTVSANRE